MAPTDNPLGGSRSEVIRTVSTPLGFFALVVLVIEVILGALAATGTGEGRTITVGVMLVVIIGLVGIVAYFAYHRPEALFGRRYREEENVDPALITAPFRSEIQRLTEDNQRLRTELETLTSARLRILSVLGADSADSRTIIERLGAANDPHAQNTVLSAIGKLVEDGTIEQDGTRSAGHYRLKKAK
jgi:hypothetical protein